VNELKKMKQKEFVYAEKLRKWVYFFYNILYWVRTFLCFFLNIFKYKEWIEPDKKDF
jgi:hypothetical protein